MKYSHGHVCGAVYGRGCAVKVATEREDKKRKKEEFGPASLSRATHSWAVLWLRALLRGQ